MKLLFLAFWLTTQHHPDTAATTLRSAEQAVEELRFEAAEKAFQKALLAPGSVEQRRQAWRGLALAKAFMGDVRGAKACFQTLLLLDANATVDETWGPKVLKPFTQAKKELGSKQNRIFLERNISGEVWAFLSEDVPLAATYELHARIPGKEWQVEKARPLGRLRIRMGDVENVEAWAVAKDSQGGELYRAGSPEKPQRF